MPGQHIIKNPMENFRYYYERPNEPMPESLSNLLKQAMVEQIMRNDPEIQEVKQSPTLREKINKWFREDSWN